MKQSSTRLMKLAVILMGGLVAIVASILLVQDGFVACTEALNGSMLAYTILGILVIICISMVPYYVALYQVYKLLTYIDYNKAFSSLSVKAVKKIKQCAFSISILYVIWLPLIYTFVRLDNNAPGMIPVFIAIVVAVFAAVLEKLLKEAIEMKIENDLIV